MQICVQSIRLLAPRTIRFCGVSCHLEMLLSRHNQAVYEICMLLMCLMCRRTYKAVVNDEDQPLSLQQQQQQVEAQRPVSRRLSRDASQRQQQQNEASQQQQQQYSTVPVPVSKASSNRNLLAVQDSGAQQGSASPAAPGSPSAARQQQQQHHQQDLELPRPASGSTRPMSAKKAPPRLASPSR